MFRQKDFDQILDKLEKSKFRASFHLRDKDFDYINQKGLQTIKQHAYDFVEKRLAPAHPANDGKQTPMRGHPVFVAQHATATCCRGCLFKWHKVCQGVELSQKQIDFVVNLIMAWISRQMSKKQHAVM